MKTTTKMNYLDSGYELTEMTYEDQAFSFESSSSGGSGSKKYNVIKMDITQSPDYSDLALFYLVGEHSMDIIYSVLTMLSGITVDSTNINIVMASILSNSTEISELDLLFGALVATTEKIYVSFTDADIGVFKVYRLMGNSWSISGSNLECQILFNQIANEYLNPTLSGNTLADWKTITITLENYKANDGDDIYNQEAA